MATVGQQLLQPELGWTRIDDRDKSIKYTGSGWTQSGVASSYYNSTNSNSSKQGDAYTFSFVGTAFRLIDMIATNRSAQLEINVDGTKETVSFYGTTNQFQTIIYEKLNLENKEHTITVTKMDVTTADGTKQIVTDAIDIIGAFTTYNVGEALTTPEAGWKRYDDVNMAFKGNTKDVHASAYAGTLGGGINVSFDFTGTKLRIIMHYYNDTSHSGQVQVTIDGQVYPTFSTKTKSQFQTLAFEVTGLTLGRHVVSMRSLDGQAFRQDAIDIDSTGRLLHPDEVTDPKDLAIGKRIRCNYKSATSGAVGAFSGLGQETKDFIPVTSSATPDGDFYYIVTDKDFAGRWVGVADRNVQHSISWDTLNTAKIASGGGLPINYYKRISTTPSDGVATANQEAGVAYSALKAFDGDTSTFWGPTEGLALPMWLNFNFNQPQVINRMRMYTRAYWAGMEPPQDFNIQASNTGLFSGEQVTLYTGIQPIVSDGFFEHIFINDIAYKHYRIVITTLGSGNGGNNLNIQEVEFYQKELPSFKFNTRLLTGGTSATDKDNEWDQWIVESTLGGSIAAGDDIIWNWKQALITWTSTTDPLNSANRAVRGFSDVANRWQISISNSTSASRAFRPVLVVESIFTPIQKHLILHGGQYKKWDGTQFVSVSANPTEADFLSNGVDNLTIIPESAWNALGTFEVATYRNENTVPKTEVKTPKSAWRSVQKDYVGFTVLETEMEDLPVGRKVLLVHADHVNCTFKYSLNGGTTWYTIAMDEVKDITSQEGNELKIQVTLPDNTASITALSYAWA